MQAPFYSHPGAASGMRPGGLPQYAASSGLPPSKYPSSHASTGYPTGGSGSQRPPAYSEAGRPNMQSYSSIPPPSMPKTSNPPALHEPTRYGALSTSQQTPSYVSAQAPLGWRPHDQGADGSFAGHGTYTRPYLPTSAQGTVLAMGPGSEREKLFAKDTSPQYPLGEAPYGMPARSQHPPPRSAIDASCNASEEYVQGALGKMPQDSTLYNKLHIPLGFAIRPLAPCTMEVPEVSVGTGKVVRCCRCRTYVNGFCKWEAGGARWVCNICNTTNECPQHFYCAFDDTGERSDRYQRPELSSGSVEFIAPTDYMVRPPQPPTYLFLIEVTAASIASGLLATVCQAIKAAIQTGDIPGGNRTQFGLMTFDSSIHFYKLDSKSPSPHMVVVSDLSDVFVPLPDGVLVNLRDTRASVESLLDLLPTMWSQQRITLSCAGSAMKAAHEAIKTWGGRVLVFLATTPALGDFANGPLANKKKATGGAAFLSASFKSSLDSSKDPGSSMACTNEDCKDFTTVAAQFQLTYDIYACPVIFGGPEDASRVTPEPFCPDLDLKNLAVIAWRTGGELRYYPGFNALTCADKLRMEVIHAVTRTVGWESVMRIRVSRSWRIINWYGAFHFRRQDLLCLPCAHQDQNFTITVELEGEMAADPVFSLQAAYLYTNSDGERRIRVHNLCLPVTQHASQIVESLNEKAAALTLAHMAIEQAMKTNLADGRDLIETHCAAIMSATHKISSAAQNASLSGRGIYSQDTYRAQEAPALLMFPYYTLGLLKSVALREGREVSPDMRIFHWLRLSSLPLQQAASYMYPRLLDLHDLPQEAGTADVSGAVVLPTPLSLSAAHLSQSGVYLLEDGEAMLLWIGRAIDPMWLQSVLGVANLDHINPQHADAMLGATGTALGMRVAAITETVRASQLPFMKLSIIRQGTPQENQFYAGLIEDRSQSMMLSFQEFMQKISRHRRKG